MKLNRFKHLLEAKLGEVKPLISEQEEMSYTVKNDATFENATSELRNELKIFKGAKFVKKGNLLVANTKYQFVDSRTGNPVLVGKYQQEKPNLQTGEVTYNCAEGKFSVKASKDKYYQQYGGLTKALAPLCNSKVNTKTATTDQTAPKAAQNTQTANHVCDTDKTSKIGKGKSYNYCYNKGKYYFKGTVGEYQTKNPNWTEATGKGLDSIKEKIFPKTSSWEKFPCVVNHPDAVKKILNDKTYGYEIQGVTYYSNGRKTSPQGNVNYTCDDAVFKIN
jgi:hypothetical protein